MARSAAVRSSHQRTEHQVIGAQPPLGSGNQALRNEVSRSTVVDGQVSNAIADGIEFEEVEIEGAAVASEEEPPTNVPARRLPRQHQKP
jgi:hypothetical protein